MVRLLNFRIGLDGAPRESRRAYPSFKWVTSESIVPTMIL